MRILIDLQPLQTPAAADRGVGKYTNGFLGELASSHEVYGMRRAAPYLVPPTVDVPAVEIRPGLSAAQLEQVVSEHGFDVVVNCSGPYWSENVIVSGLRNSNRPLIASIFHDVIPWVFPDVYLQDPYLRRDYHNRCVDLYARADLVCCVSRNSSDDVRRFGHATDETVTTISEGVRPLVPERRKARGRWKIPRPYILSVSGDEFRKNSEALIAAFLKSHLRHSRCLVLVISNDALTGFSSRMRAKYNALEAQGVFILPEVAEDRLGALYRDSDAFVFASLYEGFGIPLVEAMQFGKWVISARTSSLDEVSGPALLAPIENPSDIGSLVVALDHAGQRLNEGRLDEAVPRNQAKKFTWAQVARNFEQAVVRRRKAMRLNPSDEVARRPRLFWASPFLSDVSGIAFYSEDLLGSVSKRYDIVLVPNAISTFVPTSKTGRFKIVEAQASAVLALSEGKPPLIFYNMGNSHFHLELLDLLFATPGIVLLHDSFVGGLEGLWRERVAGDSKGRPGFDGRPLDAQIIESSRLVLFLCEHAKTLIAPEHLAGRQTHVVPLYARYKGRISAARRVELRRKYAIPEDAFVVTTTGFQGRMKLPELVIQGCIELKRFEDAPVYVQVLGRFWDAAIEAEVRALLKESGIRAFVSYEFVDEKVLTERVALSDVAVFLRGWDTGGPSAGLNDALGMGIPGLVTDDFALREYPKTAVLRVANNEVTEGLILLYRHPAVRQSLAAGGLLYALEVSPERIAAKLCQIFSQYEQDRSGPGRREASDHRVEKAARPVFVDVTFGLQNNARSGLQRVEREIASGLRKLNPGAQYFILVAWDNNSRRFHVVSLDHLKNRESLPLAKTWLAACPVADIGDNARLFILGSNWPLGDSYFSDVLALAQRGVQVSVLIPDLIPLRHRSTFYAHHPAGTTIDHFKRFCLKVVPVCTNVLTISNYVMADIQKLLVEIECGTHEKRAVPKIHVLRLGVDWAAPFGDAVTASPPASWNQMVKNPYVLCVSTLEKRKNHERLLEAFAKVRKQVANVDLVLVGGVDGSISEETLEFIRRSTWIHYFESVDDSILRHLYEECLFTVYPSLEEGYGLPVIESFRYGKFCLASQAGAIPEAGGIFADYFDPVDIRMLSEKLLKYVADPLELEKRVSLLASYKPTSWRSTAWQIAEIFFGDEVAHAFGVREKV